MTPPAEREISSPPRVIQHARFDKLTEAERAKLPSGFVYEALYKVEIGGAKRDFKSGSASWLCATDLFEHPGQSRSLTDLAATLEKHQLLASPANIMNHVMKSPIGRYVIEGFDSGSKEKTFELAALTVTITDKPVWLQKPRGTGISFGKKKTGEFVLHPPEKVAKSTGNNEPVSEAELVRRRRDKASELRDKERERKSQIIEFGRALLERLPDITRQRKEAIQKNLPMPIEPPRALLQAYFPEAQNLYYEEMKALFDAMASAGIDYWWNNTNQNPSRRDEYALAVINSAKSQGANAEWLKQTIYKYYALPEGKIVFSSGQETYVKKRLGQPKT